ncbi:MAG: hypothetical protein AAF788_01960, partial [Pseudomonadota bacterium]
AEVEGFKIGSDGVEDMVFALERVDPGMSRPVYFNLDWEGKLLVRAENPEGFVAEYDVEPGMRGTDLPLVVANTDDCRLRSPESF